MSSVELYKIHRLYLVGSADATGGEFDAVVFVLSTYEDGIKISKIICGDDGDASGILRQQMMRRRRKQPENARKTRNVQVFKEMLVNTRRLVQQKVEKYEKERCSAKCEFKNILEYLFQ